MSKGSVAPLIKEYYPEYYMLKEYPAGDCAVFKTTKEKWGILGNFARTPLVVEGLTFNNSEKLFQLMKFTDEDTLLTLYRINGIPFKRKARSLEKVPGLRRPDWGRIIVDCMKYCLQTKYEQSEEFRNTLNETAGLFIVEDETNRPGAPTTWGTILDGDMYKGSNLMGRLLMELRDNGKLEYHLPDDIFDFISILKSSGQI